MDYSRFFNEKALQKDLSCDVLSAFRAMKDSMSTCIPLGIGQPNPEIFPFSDIKVTMKDGSVSYFDKTDLNKALQYSEIQGFPELVTWFKKWQKKIHNPPAYEADDHSRRMDCMVVNGSMDGFVKTLEILVEKGENILVEQPGYVATSIAMKNASANLLGVDMDEDGMNPGHLRHVLSKWEPSDVKDPKSGIPKLLYCCPSVGNPSGVRLTMERRKEIYKIAQTYDLIILEDDPYYFLQFSEPIVPSFLSIDVDGRVLRFDSFAKIFSAGIRIGIVSGPSTIIEKIVDHYRKISSHASGLSQLFLYNFLNKTGHDGFKQYLDKNKELYKRKRDECVDAVKKHLAGLAEWTVPSGGIFIWIKLLNISDSFDVVLKAIEHGVIVIGGQCMQQAKPDEPCPYIRVAYSTCTKENFDIAFGKLAQILGEKTSRETEN